MRRSLQPHFLSNSHKTDGSRKYSTFTILEFQQTPRHLHGQHREIWVIDSGSWLNREVLAKGKSLTANQKILVPDLLIIFNKQSNTKEHTAHTDCTRC